MTAAALFVGEGQEPPPVAAAPANDAFSNAITIVATATDPVVATGSTVGATTETGEPTSCFTGATVWYSWTSPGFAGTVAFDAYGSSFDTVLGVYTGNAVNALSGVGCNDQFGGPMGGIAFSFAASTTYRIQVGGSFGATGNFVLNISFGASMVVNTATDATTPDAFLSLREAILASIHPSSPCAVLSQLEQGQVLNCGGGGLAAADLIHFNPGAFPPGAPASILLGSSLPTIASGDTISGIGAGVIVDGQVTVAENCFTINGSSNRIQGLDIRRCGNDGVVIIGGSSNLVGVDLSNVPMLPQERNIIRETPGIGMRIISSGGANAVYGNYIGTNEAGAAGLGNGVGVMLTGTSFQQIGAPGAGSNLISGNTSDGIRMTTSSQISVLGNRIGTSPAGTGDLGNGVNGILLEHTSMSRIEGNVISGNASNGVQITGAYATRNVVVSNLIGLDGSGSGAIPNDFIGVLIDGGATSNTIGGTTAGAGNVISGNLDYGVYLGGSGGSSIYNSTDVPKAIADFTTATSVINIPELATVTKVAVTVNITHTYDGDLTISLTNPAGYTVPLSIRNGGSGDNYTNTTFDDDAHLCLCDFSPPYAGTFSPDSPLSQFDGSLTRGTWTLSVADDFGADQGSLNSWSLTFITDGNEVAGNYIGTNAAGTQALANTLGVAAQTPSNVIGSSVAGGRNLISGNVGYGVDLQGASAANNRVIGNYIGTDVTGDTALANGFDGVRINGGGNNVIGGGATERNVISGNSRNGIAITAAGSGNLVTGNHIGTNAAGTAALGNTNDGVLIKGGAQNNQIGGTSAQRNVISGNGGSGVRLEDLNTWFNSIRGNYIGTDATGGNDLGNTINGVEAINLAGNNVIGEPSQGNVISGNDQDGVHLSEASGSFVRSNFIGTSAGGTAAVPNAGSGVELTNTSYSRIGGDDATYRNVISGNTGVGVQIGNPGSQGVYVQANYIGTQADGLSPLGNAAGVALFGGTSNNQIGGASGEENTIAYNTTYGIVVHLGAGIDSTGNRFQSNSIHSNGFLGIDLGALGVTPNDSGDFDSGPNNYQNYPELLYADSVSGQINIIGSLRSKPNKLYELQFFISDSCDAAGHGEGARFVGETNLITDASGNVAFVASFFDQLPGFITATATDDDSYDTSEFSNCIPADYDGDYDLDGFTNNAESGHPLCLGGIDDDSDTVVNDGCPGGPPALGFSEGQVKIGTNATDSCGTDGWPADLQPNNKLDIGDFGSFLFPLRGDGSFNKITHAVPDPSDATIGRWNLLVDGTINIGDLNALNPAVNAPTSRPPMFGGQPAFFTNMGSGVGVCPFPP
jgi:subtilisin-like proprotein convertase family protein